MFEYIEGILSIKNLNYVVLNINGLGYKIYTSIKTYESLLSLGEKEKLYIYNLVKEDELSLYGFKTEIEREIFIYCISINGIGAKKALAILSTFTLEELASIASTKNYKELSKVPGIGIKKAEKIIVDLNDKLNNININTVDNEEILEIMNKKENLRLAMESLGYEKINISNFISEEEIKELEMQDLIKIVLKNINNKK